MEAIDLLKYTFTNFPAFVLLNYKKRADSIIFAIDASLKG